MTRITRRDATRLLGGALSLPAIGVPLVRRASAQPQDFKIGVIASMTGPAAPFFKEYVEGFQAYAKSWNTRGGVNGRPVVLNINDDESAPAPAANAYRRVAADPDTTPPGSPARAPVASPSRRWRASSSCPSSVAARLMRSAFRPIPTSLK
jgi:Periplasmic binding protein